MVPNIYKCLSDVRRRPVTLNCGTPTEKVSEFLDFHLKAITRNGNSYLKHSSHFIEKIKNIDSVPDNVLSVTADVVGLCPSIQHSAGLKSLKKHVKTELINKYLQVI